jgi:hypothetical protein
VPAWAAKQASCGGQPALQEGLVMQGNPTNAVLVDLTSTPANPQVLCTTTASWGPQLVTQRMISWSATQGNPSSPGPSLIATLDLFSGTSAVVASWTGGGFMDGLHAWSSDQGLLAYITSDASAVSLHLLSGGGDRVVGTLGAVPGRGPNLLEDDYFLGFSSDGQYFAFVQTFTASGDHLQVRRAGDGSLVYSQATATMASWSSIGSKLYFRQPNSAVIDVWDPATGVSQAFAQQVAWIRPRPDAGADNLAFTVRDISGTPHVWLYGSSARLASVLKGVRSSPAFLTPVLLFYMEEAMCTANCGLGLPFQPDGHTFVYDTGRQAETASNISQVLGSWPRLGQI